jgi:hypothetical protein
LPSAQQAALPLMGESHMEEEELGDVVSGMLLSRTTQRQGTVQLQSLPYIMHGPSMAYRALQCRHGVHTYSTAEHNPAHCKKYSCSSRVVFTHSTTEQNPAHCKKCSCSSCVVFTHIAQLSTTQLTARSAVAAPVWCSHTLHS